MNLARRITSRYSATTRGLVTIRTAPLNTQSITIFAGGPTRLMLAETITLVSRTTKRIQLHRCLEPPRPRDICECGLSPLQSLLRLSGRPPTLRQAASSPAGWPSPSPAEVRDLPSPDRQRRGPGRRPGHSDPPAGLSLLWGHRPEP